MLVPLPRASRGADALQDLAHVPLFALVGAGLAGWWQRRWRNRASAHLLGWAAAVALAGTIEILQGLVGREASLGDLWAGAAGAAAGVLIAAGDAAGPRREWRTAVAVLAAATAMAWPGLRLFDVLRQGLQPSRLGAFEDALELDRWSFHQSHAVRSHDHATEGAFALRLELQPGRYPGAGLVSPPPDWSAYGRLSCDVFLEGDSPLELRVKVEDRHDDGELRDRFQRVVSLPPGPFRLEIPLADVVAGPQGRRLDLGHVAQLRFFAVNLQSPRVLFLDNLVLTER